MAQKGELVYKIKFGKDELSKLPERSRVAMRNKTTVHCFQSF